MAGCDASAPAMTTTAIPSPAADPEVSGRRSRGVSWPQSPFARLSRSSSAGLPRTSPACLTEPPPPPPCSPMSPLPEGGATASAKLDAAARQVLEKRLRFAKGTAARVKVDKLKELVQELRWMGWQLHEETNRLRMQDKLREKKLRDMMASWETHRKMLTDNSKQQARDLHSCRQELHKLREELAVREEPTLTISAVDTKEVVISHVDQVAKKADHSKGLLRRCLSKLRPRCVKVPREDTPFQKKDSYGPLEHQVYASCQTIQDDVGKWERFQHEDSSAHEDSWHELQELQDEVEALRGQVLTLTEERKITDNLLAKTKMEREELKAKNHELSQQLSSAQQKIREGEAGRRQLHETVMELKGNIRVFCRVRPPNESEQTLVPGTVTSVVTHPAHGDSLRKSVRLHVQGRDASAEYHACDFYFDRVFRPSDSQDAVFEEISKLIQSALDGQKVCIFAYGQTGSGKTYTILGEKGFPGVIPRAVEQIFKSSKELEDQGWHFTVHMSILEIYNEEYKDLLGDKRPAGAKHNVHHDPNGKTVVDYLTVLDVSKPEQVESLLEKAMEKRAVGSTMVHDKSSRSHLVFRLEIDGNNSITQEEMQGVLNLVDLAGSERLKESGAEGSRLKETQNINKSLSALGDVIAALANQAEHIPYRNSKLTWLLKSCLGRNSKALMFVNICPTPNSANESLCSLRFATKVNSCEIGTTQQGKRQRC